MNRRAPPRPAVRPASGTTGLAADPPGQRFPPLDAPSRKQAAQPRAVLAAYLQERPAGPATSVTANRAVRRHLLDTSPRLNTANFEAIFEADLWLLFAGYDRCFFAGHLSRALPPDPRRCLRLRLSNRMTRAGGKLMYRPTVHPTRFEIVVSSHLLFSNFEDPTAAPVSINGRSCRTRLDALQSIFEHELVHLVEVLVTGHTSCRAPAFLSLARTLFGHTETTHTLSNIRDRASREHGLAPGTEVCFYHRGRRVRGFVNRITQRATVLVPDPHGRRYNDGRRYAKYYVPLSALERC